MKLSEELARYENTLILGGIPREVFAAWFAEAKRLERPRCDWTRKTQDEHESEDSE